MQGSDEMTKIVAENPRENQHRSCTFYIDAVC